MFFYERLKQSPGRLIDNDNYMIVIQLQISLLAFKSVHMNVIYIYMEKAVSEAVEKAVSECCFAYACLCLQIFSDWSLHGLTILK